jgi:hypothetical protein
MLLLPEIKKNVHKKKKYELGVIPHKKKQYFVTFT